jgi:dCTP deaminase
MIGSMILTHDQIIEAQKQGGIVIEPFAEKQVQAATYDLRVGSQGATTSTKKLVNLKEHGYLALQPGDFGVVTCLETLKLGPQYAARFGLRSKYARKGLIATTGTQIDPGFRGRLILGLTNLTTKTVALSYEDDFVTVEFHRLTEATTHPYEGAYQDRTELAPSDIEFITETEGMSLSEMLLTLRTLTQNVGALTTQIGVFKWIIPVIAAVLILGMAIIETTLVVSRGAGH